MDVQAVMARLASVCRVYQHQFHPKLNALVGQKLSQLVETPRVTSASVYLGSRQLVSAFPNPCQVFQGKTSVISFSFLYQLIANGVIGVTLKTSLLT